MPSESDSPNVSRKLTISQFIIPVNGAVMDEPSSSTKGLNTFPKTMCGFMDKIEQRIIGGTYSKRYWFALSQDSPYLYWYRKEGGISCVGRVSLVGAAFTFDPRQTGRFEIQFVLGFVNPVLSILLILVQ
ncbi:hypothetical protein AB6A40_009882 [Gnathostoma spinigerum]|uniref:Uncharacterized protein n=1 Tax=Gnathostoma spinigerum TaxID=75299 RepID=A0ABD6F0R3_9BILA